MEQEVALLDTTGRIVATNRSWRSFSERNGGDARRTGVGGDYFAACRAEGSAGARLAEALRATLCGERDGVTLEYPCHSSDEERWFTLTAARVPSGAAAHLLVQHEDITARRRAEDTARRRSTFLDEVDAAVVGTDRESRITEWNRGAQELYGWTRDEALGRPVMELVVPATERDASRDALVTLNRGNGWTGDMTLLRRDGTVFPAHVRNAPLLGSGGEVTGYVGVAIDVTERLIAEGDLRSAQQYLLAVTASMAEGLATLDDHGRIVYLNPTAERLLGWTLDEIVGEDLDRIVHVERPEDEPPGDHPFVRSRRDEHLVSVDEDSFARADGTTLPVKYTVSPLTTPDGVRGSVILFSDITRAKAERERLASEVESLTWVTRIQEGLAEGRFELHAQPIVELATGSVVQHELLIRLRDRAGDLIAPGAFLPAAERHGVIGAIDRWVVSQAAGLAADGRAVEINISADSLGDPEMVGFVERTLAAAGADPANVVIELTETAILRDEEAGRAFLERISAFGCKVALDDFGTGYGGFTYLKRLPVDFLKIDIEFVRDLPADRSSQQVVQAVVSLAAGLDKQTVAEGVEDAETLTLLRDYGVGYAQGYGIGRPQPVEETRLVQPTKTNPVA